MPRLSSEQRRLVCAQARAIAKADLAVRRGTVMRHYWVGIADGIFEAMMTMFPGAWEPLLARSERIARRFGGRGRG